MENVRIASTPLSGLRPAGQAAGRDLARLSGHFLRLAAEAPELPSLFADPEPSRDGTRIDWYGPAGKTYTPLVSLPADEQAAVLARVDELLAIVQREAQRQGVAGEALTNATALPSPRESYVYVAREQGDPPERWHPVLVCWAYVNEAAAWTGATPHIMVRPVEPPAARLPPATAGQSAMLASAPALAIAAGRHNRPWMWLWWLVLAFLLIAIAALMLPACGLGVPGYGIAHGFGASFCPGSAAAATVSDAERNRILTEIAQQLELQKARGRVTCLSEARRAAEAQSPSPSPSQTPSIADRLKREGAKTGEVQVSLAWDGTADLDLHVTCPNGEEIYYSRKSSCGGTLDVDMNSEKKSLTPVENVFWPDGKASPGRYKVTVTMYKRHDDARPSIPFQVRIKSGGEEKTFPGTVAQERTVVQVTEFTR